MWQVNVDGLLNMEYILGYSQFWSIFTVVQCNVLIVNLDFWTINNSCTEVRCLAVPGRRVDSQVQVRKRE